MNFARRPVALVHVYAQLLRDTQELLGVRTFNARKVYESRPRPCRERRAAVVHQKGPQTLEVGGIVIGI